MRLLVDECCPAALVDALRSAAHDVTFVLETTPSIDDSAVVRLATDDDRFLITLDRGIGQRVVQGGPSPPGVILILHGRSDLNEVIAMTLRALEAGESTLRDQLTILRDGQSRSRRLGSA